MKKILIATDFSPAAHNAGGYGIQLAKALKANVILFSAYQVAHPFAALNVQVSGLAAMEETKKKLTDEADALVKGYDVQIEMICDEGTADESILAGAKEKEADLIIMGMKGSGKNLKKLFGSTAISLLKSSGIAVIIVPEEARFSTPKNILYASDVFMDTTILAIDQISWLTHFFASKLFVVRVVNDSYEEVREQVNTPQNLRKELKKLSTTFHFPVNNNISHGLTEFMKEQPVDLLVMSPHKHEWLERLFIKSETKDMASHTNLPVLMLTDAAVTALNMTPLEIGEKYSYDE